MNIKKQFLLLFLVVAIVFGLSISMQSLAWTEPTNSPPQDDVTGLLRADANQQKTGLLTLTKSGTGLVVNPGNFGVGTLTPGGKLGIGDANTYIDIDGSNNLTFTDANAGTGTLSYLLGSADGDFASGGSAGGDNRTLGNTDAYALGFITNNQTYLYIASSTENVGINTSEPNGILGIEDANTYITNVTTNLVFRDLYNSNTTLSELIAQEGDFLDGGDTATANRSLGNGDSYDLGFMTASTTYLTIKSDGKVGIGTSTPQTILDVYGGVRMGWSGATCSGELAGAMRWNATTTVIEYCNTSSWSSL